MRSFNENWDGIVRKGRQQDITEATATDRKMQKAFDEMKKVVNRDLTWKKAQKSFSDFKAMYMTLARSDITDIVSRLRRTDENRGVPICSEAADTIERLRKERDALFEFIKSKGGDRTKFRKLMKEMSSMKSYADYDATDTRWSFFSPSIGDKTLKDWFEDARIR